MHGGTTFIEKVVAHRERPTPDLSARRPDALPQLVETFQRMVAKDPAARFASMTEVVAALESCRALVPVDAGSVTSAGHAAFTAGRSVVSADDNTLDGAALARPHSGSGSGIDSRTFNEAPKPRTLRKWIAPAGVTAAAALIAPGVALLLRTNRPEWRESASSVLSPPASAPAAVHASVTQAAARSEPPPPPPPPPPPSYRPEDGWIPLFNGRDLSGWHTHDGQPASAAAFQGEWRTLLHAPWEAAPASTRSAVIRSAAAVAGPRLLVRRAGIAVTREHLVSDRSFGDLQLHAEVFVPERGSMGLCLMQLYELRIQPGVPLLSGGVPGLAGPTTQALRPTNQWQTLDLDFRAPRFDDTGHKTQNARILSARLNGQLILYNIELRRPSAQMPLGGEVEAPSAPLMLRDLGAFALRTLLVRPTGPTTASTSRVVTKDGHSGP